MIEAVMYMVLGFCAAGLIGLAILPAFYRRAARLTEEALRAVNPSSYAEVRAAQDQARARHAIELRRVERQLDDERAKATKHHLEAARLRGEIEELNRVHQSQVSGLESKLGSMHGDQKAVDLLTAEVTALRQKLADSEKALAESWISPARGELETEPVKKNDDSDDWLPAADTMALATITGLEAEVATLKARLAKHEPAVAAEIETEKKGPQISRLAELEAQLVDAESKYVSAQAEVTRLSLLLTADNAREAGQREDLQVEMEHLTRDNAHQRSELLNKERALERLTGQLDELKKDLASTPALSELRQEFRALAAKIAGSGTVDVSDTGVSPSDTHEQSPDAPAQAANGVKKTDAAVPKGKKRTQRVVVPADKTSKPAAIKIKTAKVPAPAENGPAPKTTEIASAAEALVSRIVASNAKNTQPENTAATPDTATGTEPDADPQGKSPKQKKKDVA